MKKICMLITLLSILISCQPQKNEQATTKEVKEEKNLVVENILNRRSIRSFKPEQIKESQMDTIINCGINAPSAMNKQSWQVRVIQKAELIREISDGFTTFNKKTPDPNVSVFYKAPTVILIAAQKGNTMSIIDCALLGENIVLAAESMNIGSCIIAGPTAYLNSPEAAKTILPKLSLPEDYEPLYTIALGYKNESPEAKPRDAGKVQVIK